MNPMKEMEPSGIGLGSWVFGGGDWGYAWGDQSESDSIATVRAAVEAGINWIDTAPAYGLGQSEELIGRAIAQLPASDRPYVFTKCGLVWESDDRMASPRKVMRPDSVRQELEDSLRRLGVERIDLYLVHWPGDGGLLSAVAGEAGGTDEDGDMFGTPIEEYWQLMTDLVAEGKVAAAGLSNHSVDDLERAAKVGPVHAIQPPFSLLTRTAAPEIAWAAENDADVVVWSPLQSGLLSGRMSADRVANLPENDWRRRHPDFTDHLERNLALTAALGPIADRHGVTVSAVAIAWTLAWPGVTGAIVGARRPPQIGDWIAANSLELEAADLEEIERALVATGAGTGPVRPDR